MTRRTHAPLPGVVYLLGLVGFVMGTTELIVAGLLPGMAPALHVSVARGGVLITAFGIGIVVGAPVTALTTRRWSPRTILIGTLLVFASAHIAVAVATSYDVVLYARFASGLATGSYWGSALAVASAAAGRSASARAMGVIITGITVATVVGVPLGTFGGQLFGWASIFWILAILALLAIVPIIRAMPSADRKGGRPAPSQPLRLELRMLRQRLLWLVLSAMALVQAGVTACYSYLPSLLIERTHVRQGVVPIVQLVFGLGAFAGAQIGGRVGDRHPWSALLSSVGLTALVLAALSTLSRSPTIAIGLVAVLGVAGMLSSPILMSQVVHTTGSESRLAVALTPASFNIGIAGGSFLGSLILANDGGFQTPALVGAGLTALGVVPVFLLWRASRHRTAT